MARVHTDLMHLLSRYEDACVFIDVPLNQQTPLEYDLEKKGLYVIKYQYVK